MAIPSLALIPTGFKDGKLYSVLPESGAGDFDVVRGSGATRVNKDGLVESMVNNEPRLDYTDGGCPSLLLEPQSTNLIIHSQDFSQWSSSNVVLSNNIASPDGASGATLLSGNGVSSFPSLTRGVSASGDVSYSLFVKKELRDTIALRLQGTDIGGAGETNAVYTYTFSTNSFTSESSGVAESFSAQPLVDGWIRLQLNFTSTTITTCRIYPAYGTASTDGVYIWGAQIEEISYATSYIPTSGAIATRLADRVTGAGDATTFNSTEGVMYAEATVEDTGTFKTMIRLTKTDTSTSDGLWIYAKSSNQLQGVLRVGGVDQVALTSPLTYSGFVKIAFKYKENDFALWINGVEVISDASGAVFSANTLSKVGLKLGTNINPFYGKVKDLRVYNTALTDAELLTLTTP